MIITFCGHSQFVRTEKYEEKVLSILEQAVGDSPAEFFLGGYGAFDDFAFCCCKITHRSGGAYQTYCHAVSKNKTLFNIANRT